MSPSKSRIPRGTPLTVAGQSVPPGERAQIELPVARLPTATQLTIPVTVVGGPRPGPVLWISAAVHGDLLNEVEIIRRALASLEKPLTRGAILVTPIVHVFGFIGQSRYLPDRRDLNRCFPGSPKGSLASRVASSFRRELVQRATHGLDLRTASICARPPRGSRTTRRSGRSSTTPRRCAPHRPSGRRSWCSRRRAAVRCARRPHACACRCSCSRAASRGASTSP